MSTVLPLKIGAASWAVAPLDHSTARTQRTDCNARTAQPISSSSVLKGALQEKARGSTTLRARPSGARQLNLRVCKTFAFVGRPLWPPYGPRPAQRRRAQGPPLCNALSLQSALDAHGDAHAAADAQRGEAFLGVALLHFVEQRDQHARAGRSDRMANRDRTTVDIDLAGVPAKVLVDRAGLGGKRLVCFDEVEVADGPARLLEGGAGRRN